MDSVNNPTAQRKLLAYTLPMAVFLGGLALVTLLKAIGGSFWLTSPEYWVFPLQTFASAAVLFWFWRDYEFQGLKKILFVLVVAVFVFALWIAPQMWLGFSPRTEGFNPDSFSAQPTAYWTTVCLRFLRLVVIVPLVEEIFWRGFLLRYFIHEKFEEVPFGAFSWLSFAVVTVGFTFAHTRADWVAAAVTGALYNLVAYRTRSLTSCVLAHAVTNLLLGLWIMQSRQWGFW
ncbi:MAG: CAAX prenyl protease-related protein [Chthoniobacterales bacterium]|nr:CAAX prenyl protease-related protein [Chthoniobacterales bacterium]